MQVTALNGRTIDVGRRWCPWSLHTPSLDEVRDASPFSLAGSTRDVGGFVFDLILGVIMLLVVGGGLLVRFVLEALEALALLALLPLVAALRVLRVLPWVIRARDGATVLGVAKVRGWRGSEELIHELAADFQFGRDPFGHAGTTWRQADSAAQPITRSW
ncbi:MAG: hypothetical protein JWQ32_651 [Marmoricola sp.]|nr:hypothetical protein [Marmoricola sp.]